MQPGYSSLQLFILRSKRSCWYENANSIRLKIISSVTNMYKIIMSHISSVTFPAFKDFIRLFTGSKNSFSGTNYLATKNVDLKSSSVYF